MIAAAVHERLWMALPADTFASTPSTVVTAGAPTTWAASALYHQIGRADGDGWSANVAQDAPGFLSYGPYTTALPAGDQIATWNLMRDNVTADNANVVTLDAVDTTTGTVLASRVVTRQQCGMAYQYQGFSLPLTSQAGHTLEFRVFWHDTAYVKLQQVRVQSRANGVTETDQYDGDGNRVSRTRAGVTTTYGFGRWEQDGATTRKYYSFQGQVVAIRDGTTVSYLHGDHPGSVSATTNAAGQLSSMQHFDPWGKVLAGNVTQTKRNFTGQYLDQTGLLYYTARYYDPGLGRFISADTIAPGLENPQNRNRYSYALNNPLKYTDPTGHCVDDPNGIEPSCDQVINDLKQVDILVGDPTYWLREELAVILEGTNDFMKWAGWDAKEFRGEMGRINLERKSEMTDDKGNTAETWTFGVSSKIDFYAGAFGSDRDWTKATVVHELSHVWDGLTQRMSTGMTRATGSVSSGIPFINESYIPKGAIARGYAGDNQREDWAESVAAMVYPGEYNAISKERQSYVRDSIREVRAKR